MTFTPDLLPDQKNAAGPLSVLIADHAAQLRREFPELSPGGHDAFVIAQFDSPALKVDSLLKQWRRAYPREAPPSQEQLEHYKNNFEKMFNIPKQHTLAATATLEGATKENEGGSPFFVIGVNSGLCPSCEIPSGKTTSCDLTHPDVLRMQEMKRFGVFSHEIGHIIDRLTTEKNDNLVAVNPDQQAIVDRWQTHERENRAETFRLLRTIQVYGEEGYHALRNDLAERVERTGDKEVPTVANVYYPPEQRFALLEWARENRESLRGVPWRDLYEIARANSPALSLEEFADLQARTQGQKPTLQPEAVQSRLQNNDYAGALPYLSVHDGRAASAEVEKTLAQNAAAALNPYRPPEVRTDKIPFNTWPGGEAADATIDMARFSAARESATCEKAVLKNGVEIDGKNYKPSLASLRGEKSTSPPTP